VKEQEASVSLPRTFDLSKMKRVTADLGKCPVCGVAKVEWIDEESGVMLCGRCYPNRRSTRNETTAPGFPILSVLKNNTDN
jgi:hypothetical protein